MREPQRVWIILMSDIMLVTEFDQIEQHYIIIEEIIKLSDCSIKYEAISPDGSPDLKWNIQVNDQKGFGSRRYTFEADTAELAAMWKCCLSRQIDLSKQNSIQQISSPVCSPSLSIYILISSFISICVKRTPSRTRSEADMNRLGGSSGIPSGSSAIGSGSGGINTGLNNTSHFDR